MSNRPLQKPASLPGSWVLGFLILLSWRMPAQSPFAITDIYLDYVGRPVVRVPSTSVLYSILYRGAALDEIQTPVALEIQLAPENPDYVELVDQGSLASGTQFYLVDQVPVNAPFDLDGDGLSDVYELTLGPRLDPLSPVD